MEDRELNIKSNFSGKIFWYQRFTAIASDDVKQSVKIAAITAVNKKTGVS